MASISRNAKNLDSEDAFVNVMFQEQRNDEAVISKGNDSFYEQFVDKASGSFSDPTIYGANALRKLYPKYSLVMTADYGINITSFQGAHSQPLSTSELVTNIVFVPLARRLGSVPGVLVDTVQFGGFKVVWDNYDFIVYIAQFQVGFGTKTQHFILHEGPEDPARNLILAAGTFRDELHDEIWVYNQGFWAKDHGLWIEVQKADWKDVILKDEFKKNLQKDVYGFFKSEAVYKELAIPWKRGLILHGPPGNGKTISIKAIMKSCDDKGFKPLYVKSFKHFAGEEAAMASVFSKARQLSPCVIVLEDLDSLINNQNRSFFLNQLDGLEGNDGLLVIGTTNHFDRLDPGLSTRPSRFDRKYLFDDPDKEERTLYAKYWQKKLVTNKDVSYSDSLVEEIAESTEKFSFAYLKEAFVSSLVLLAGIEEDNKPSFASVIHEQIKTLRKQLDKSPNMRYSFSNVPHSSVSNQNIPSRIIQTHLDEYSNHISRSDIDPSRKHATVRSVHSVTGSSPPTEFNERHVRTLLDSLSNGAGHGGPNRASSRVYASEPTGSADVLTIPGAMPHNPNYLGGVSQMYKPSASP